MHAVYDVIYREAPPQMNVSRDERRRQSRVRLATPLVGRIGTFGAVLLDISEGGAKLEVYAMLRTGSTARFRFEWEGARIETDCHVLSCRVARLAGGEGGATVYHARVRFTEPDSNSAMTLKKIVATHISRALAEQVANAKGVIPLNEQKMPIFRGNALASNKYEEVSARKNAHLLPAAEVVQQRGYIRCRLQSGRMWTRKWTLSPEQPEDGFTVSVHESPDQIALLCKTFRDADADTRTLIQRMAALSIEGAQESHE